MGNLYDSQEVHTVYTYPLNGTLREFNIPFEYLARKFVRVTLVGKDRRVLALKDDYRFATKSVIQTNKAWGPADGYNTIEIRRHTSSSDRLVEFTDGSILRAYDMNVSQIQTLHVAEEARESGEDVLSVDRDGNYNAKGHRIVNAGDAVDDQDLVTWGQVKDLSTHGAPHAEEAKKAAAEAKHSRDEAWSFKNQANTAKDEAVAAARSALQVKEEVAAHTTQAKTAADTAVRSATQAGNFSASAGTASNEARGFRDEAEQWAGKAKEEADKIIATGAGGGRLQEATASIADDQTVVWKGRHEMVGIGTGRALTLHNDPSVSDGAVFMEAKRGNTNLWALGSLLHNSEDVSLHNYSGSGFVTVTHDDVAVSKSLRVQEGAHWATFGSDGSITGNIWKLLGASSGKLYDVIEGLGSAVAKVGGDTDSWFFLDHNSGLLIQGATIDHTQSAGSTEFGEWTYHTPFSRDCLMVIPVKISSSEVYAATSPFIQDFDNTKCSYRYEKGTQTSLIAFGY